MHLTQLPTTSADARKLGTYKRGPALRATQDSESALDDKRAVSIQMHDRVDIATGRLRGAEIVPRFDSAEVPGANLMPTWQSLFDGGLARDTLFALLTAGLPHFEAKAALLDGPTSIAIRVPAQILASGPLAVPLVELLAHRRLTPNRLTLILDDWSSEALTPVLGELMAPLAIKGVRLALNEFELEDHLRIDLWSLPFHELSLCRRYIKQRADISTRELSELREVVRIGHSTGVSVSTPIIDSFERFDDSRQIGCDLATTARPWPLMTAEHLARAQVSFGAVIDERV